MNNDNDDYDYDYDYDYDTLQFLNNIDVSITK